MKKSFHEFICRKGPSALTGITALLLAVLAFSCTETKTQTVITMRGSNTVGEELAPKLITEYRKDHPNLAFDTEFKATPYGIGALLAGRCDIAAASRLVTTNEQQLARERSVEFKDYVIGSYSVSVIVNSGSPVSDLSKDQVRDIFTGVIQNWKEVGGPDAPIHLYVRDPISGTHIGFQELAMEKKPYAPGIKTFTSYEGIVKAVADDPAGIGYSSVNGTRSGNVKTLTIGGIAATDDSVNKGLYAYGRPLRLYTDKSKETPEAHDFIEFVVSAKGQNILKELGYIPHS